MICSLVTKNKVLPAPHAQRDAPDDGEVVGTRRVDRYLGCRAARQAIGRGVVVDVDDGDRPAVHDARAHILKGAGRLELPGGDSIDHLPDLSPDDLSGQCVEGNLSFVSGANALERVLLEACSQLLI